MVQEQLQLAHDPFLYEAAEIEVQAFPDDFFAYFVKPDEQLWQCLLSAQHVVAFGMYGSGKTTLRLNLARQLRYVRPPVLAVTCDFLGYAGQDKRVFIAQQMAKDLLIQTLEVLDVVVVDDERDMRVIRHLRGLLYGGLRATMQRVVQGAAGERIDLLLAGRGRESSDYMQLSPALREFLQKLLAATRPEQPAPGVAVCLDAAQQLGFSQVYVLADGFDARQSSAAEMEQALISLAALATKYNGQLVLKVFLPARVKEAVAGLLDKLSAMTGGQVVSVDLAWDEEGLSEVLAQRFRAARRPDMAQQGIDPFHTADSIPDPLPRSRIASVSALLDDAQAVRSK
jgi:hypothetical protein